MTAIRDRIISLVGQGVSQALVAEATGVTPSYVSQLLQQPDVSAEVAAIRAESLEGDIAQDKAIDSAETAALKLLAQKMVFAKPGELAGIFGTLNKARRRALIPETADTAGVGALNVTIVLPKQAAISLTMNSESQVIEVDGRTLAPLPSRELPKLAARMATEAGTRMVELPQAVQPQPHELAVRERMTSADAARAAQLLKASQEMTVVMNGVEVVI